MHQKLWLERKRWLNIKWEAFWWWTVKKKRCRMGNEWFPSCHTSESLNFTLPTIFFRALTNSTKKNSQCIFVKRENILLLLINAKIFAFPHSPCKKKKNFNEKIVTLEQDYNIKVRNMRRSCIHLFRSTLSAWIAGSCSFLKLPKYLTSFVSPVFFWNVGGDVLTVNAENFEEGRKPII